MKNLFPPLFGLRPVLSCGACLLVLVLCLMPRAWAQSSYRVVTEAGANTAPGHVAFVDTVGKRIVELDRAGKVVWKWQIRDSLIGKGNLRSGADLEWISADDSFLLVIPFRGIFRVNREGRIIWRHLTTKVSHDADLLPNGNILHVFGWDSRADAQVVEINPEGKKVWTWKVKGKLDKALYKPVRSEKRPSYAHTNAVIRLGDGDTIISLRNFNRVVRVSPGGEIKKVWGPIARVHEPNLLPDGTLVASPHRRKPRGHSVIAISADGEKRKIYKNALGILPIRTVEILGNGNYLLTGGEEIVEINDEGTVVWHVAIYSKSQSSQPQKRPRRRAQQGKRDAGGRNRKKRGTGGGRSDERGVYKAVWVGSRR